MFLFDKGSNTWACVVRGKVCISLTLVVSILLTLHLILLFTVVIDHQLVTLNDNNDDKTVASALKQDSYLTKGTVRNVDLLALNRSLFGNPTVSNLATQTVSPTIRTANSGAVSDITKITKPEVEVAVITEGATWKNKWRKHRLVRKWEKLPHKTPNSFLPGHGIGKHYNKKHPEFRKHPHHDTQNVDGFLAREGANQLPQTNLKKFPILRSKVKRDTHKTHAIIQLPEVPEIPELEKPVAAECEGILGKLVKVTLSGSNQPELTTKTPRLKTTKSTTRDHAYRHHRSHGPGQLGTFSEKYHFLPKQKKYISPIHRRIIQHLERSSKEKDQLDNEPDKNNVRINNTPKPIGDKHNYRLGVTSHTEQKRRSEVWHHMWREHGIGVARNNQKFERPQQPKMHAHHHSEPVPTELVTPSTNQNLHSTTEEMSRNAVTPKTRRWQHVWRSHGIGVVHGKEWHHKRETTAPILTSTPAPIIKHPNQHEIKILKKINHLHEVSGTISQKRKLKPQMNSIKPDEPEARELKLQAKSVGQSLYRRYGHLVPRFIHYLVRYGKSVKEHIYHSAKTRPTIVDRIKSHNTNHVTTFRPQVTTERITIHDRVTTSRPLTTAEMITQRNTEDITTIEPHISKIKGHRSPLVVRQIHKNNHLTRQMHHKKLIHKPGVQKSTIEITKHMVSRHISLNRKVQHNQNAANSAGHLNLEHKNSVKPIPKNHHISQNVSSSQHKNYRDHEKMRPVHAIKSHVFSVPDNAHKSQHSRSSSRQKEAIKPSMTQHKQHGHEKSVGKHMDKLKKTKAASISHVLHHQEKSAGKHMDKLKQTKAASVSRVLHHQEKSAGKHIDKLKQTKAASVSRVSHDHQRSKTVHHGSQTSTGNKQHPDLRVEHLKPSHPKHHAIKHHKPPVVGKHSEHIHRAELTDIVEVNVHKTKPDDEWEPGDDMGIEQLMNIS